MPRTSYLVPSYLSQLHPDLDRVHRLLHVVDAHQARAILHREEGRGNARGRAFDRATSREIPDHLLVRETREDRIACRGERGERTEQRLVVGDRLAEAEAGIEDDARLRDAG